MKSIVKIVLPPDRADAFAERLDALLHEKVPTGLTRAGTMIEAEILRGDHTNNQQTFLLIGEMTGPVGLPGILHDDIFAPFGAETTDLGDFSAIGSWKAKAEAG